MAEADRLSHDEFFSQLTSLLKACHASGDGSVVLSQKRLTYGNLPSDTAPENIKIADDPLWDINPPNPMPVLIRVSNSKGPKSRKAGKKVKAATVVQPDELEAFFLRYAEVCKKGMENLKKRDRSKKKKEKKKGKKEEAS